MIPYLYPKQVTTNHQVCAYRDFKDYIPIQKEISNFPKASLAHLHTKNCKLHLVKNNSTIQVSHHQIFVIRNVPHFSSLATVNLNVTILLTWWISSEQCIRYITQQPMIYCIYGSYTCVSHEVSFTITNLFTIEITIYFKAICNSANSVDATFFFPKLKTKKEKLTCIYLESNSGETIT